jgi:glutamate synthase (NADPH/NADH) large chain
MTTYDDAWVARMEAEFARLEAEGMYHPEQEHASCGVGLVVGFRGADGRSVRDRRHPTRSLAGWQR